MADQLTTQYQDLLEGTYDCVDRIVLNGYFRPGHSGGGFRTWWQRLTGSDATLEPTIALTRSAAALRRDINGFHKILVAHL